jgi:hypothetical protein
MLRHLDAAHLRADGMSETGAQVAAMSAAVVKAAA